MIVNCANFVTNFNDGECVPDTRRLKKESFSHGVCGGPSVEPSVIVHVIMLSIIEDYPRRTSGPKKDIKPGAEISVFTFSLVGQNIGHDCDFWFFPHNR